MKFILSKSAYQDIDSIADYTIANWGVDQFDIYFSGMKETFELIPNNPEIGRKRTEIANSLRSFPYRFHVIFYVIDNNEIIISAILHASSDIETRLKTI